MKVNNSYIMRMLLSYLPILFVTISILTFIFFSIMNQFNVSNALQANRLTAKYVVNMTDTSLKAISFEAQEAIETGGTLQQFLDEPSDRALSFDASNLLSAMMVRSGLIDSVYLYRARDGMVLDQSTIRPLGQFPDQNYMRTALDQAYTGVWSSPRLKQSEGTDELSKVNVTSLGFKIPRNSGSLGYLIINVKTASLNSYIGQAIDRTITEAQIYDNKGQAFFGENASLSAKSRLSVDIESDYTGWTYRVGIKGGQLLSFLFHGSTVWIMLGLGVIAFAIGTTFYVTRRNYRPIETILHRIERFSQAVMPADSKEKENEFAFIDQAIERLITNNMAFQEQQEEHLVIRRQQFLQTLLKGEYEDDRETWEQERQHFGLAGGQYIVGLLEMDHYVDFALKYSPGDQSLFKFITSSVAVEVSQQSGLRVVAEWMTKNQLVLLLIEENGGPLEHHMLQIAEQIRSWVEGHLNFTVTIGIGTAVDNEPAIAVSFDEAAAAVSRKVSLGLNRVIDSVEVKENKDGEWFAYLEMIRSMVRQIRMSEAEWLSELKRLFGEMAVYHLRKEDVERLLHYFIFHLEYELERMLPEITEPWVQEVKPGLLTSVEQSDTLAQLEGDFLEIISGLSARITELSQSRRHNGLMREIRDYVAQQYMDPNLSLTLLSEKFQISPKYLSQLFKESIGQNFSDFLIGLRIEHAKKSLWETDETVQDISNTLGYANPTSFIRVFKRIVGVSPGQYRESRAGAVSGQSNEDEGMPDK